MYNKRELGFLTKRFALHFCHKVVKVLVQRGFDKMFTLPAKSY